MQSDGDDRYDFGSAAWTCYTCGTSTLNLGDLATGRTYCRECYVAYKAELKFCGPASAAVPDAAEDMPYAMTPHPAWRIDRHPVAVNCFGIINLVFITVVLFGDLALYRVLHVACWVGSFAFRVHYYHPRNWWLFFMDLCYAGNHAFALALIGILPSWAYISIFILVVGPVGGGAIVLRTPVLMHHAEGFVSYFMHVGSLFAGYALRWRWDVIPVPSSPAAACGAGLLGYMAWAVPYYGLISLKPYLPFGIADMDTLLESNVAMMYGLDVPGSTTRKPAPRGSWVVFGLMHATGAVVSGLIAVWSLYNEAICLAWLFITLSSSIHFGKAFYMTCAAREVHGSKTTDRMRWGVFYKITKLDTGMNAGAKAGIVALCTLALVWLSGMSGLGVITGSMMGVSTQIPVLPKCYHGLKLLSICWCMLALAWCSGVSVQMVTTNNLPLIAGCVVVVFVQVQSRLLQGLGIARTQVQVLEVETGGRQPTAPSSGASRVLAGKRGLPDEFGERGCAKSVPRKES